MVERKRHLVKALTYRVLGSVGSATIGFVVTGNFAIGATIGVADAVAKVGMYYVHERIWYRIKWGVRSGPHGAAAAGEIAKQAPGGMQSSPEQTPVVRV